MLRLRRVGDWRSHRHLFNLRGVATPSVVTKPPDGKQLLLTSINVLDSTLESASPTSMFSGSMQFAAWHCVGELSVAGKYGLPWCEWRLLNQKSYGIPKDF